MEEKPGIWSHIGGLIRFILFISIVIVLAFFTVRWFRDRQNSDSSTNNTTSSTTKDSEKDKDSNKQNDDSKPAEIPAPEDESDEQPAETPVQTPAPSRDDTAEVPGGLNGGKNEPIENVPSTGLASNIIITAFLLGSATYLVSKNRSYLKQISDLL